MSASNRVSWTLQSNEQAMEYIVIFGLRYDAIGESEKFSDGIMKYAGSYQSKYHGF
jgi:hypothetical protein